MEQVKKQLETWFLNGKHNSYKPEDCMVQQEDHIVLKLFTDNNVYSISARPPKGDKGYLGCIASSRKPRAGESWTRGNDLPDGPYNDETALYILQSIVSYELVKIHKPISQVE